MLLERYRPLLGLLIVSLLTARATAEPFVLTVPEQGWQIAMDAPALRVFQGESKAKNFKFMAVDTRGFNVTIFVEEPEGDGATHDTCFNYYWPLAKRNPLIDQASVKVEKGKEFVNVSYLVKVAEGEPGMLNHNYYIAFQGRWTDVHISKSPAADGDDKLFEAFTKNLKYGSTSRGTVRE